MPRAGDDVTVAAPLVERPSEVVTERSADESSREDVDTGSTTRSWLASRNLTSIDAVAAVVALLLMTFYANEFLVASWTPRMAILVAVLPLGAFVMAQQAVRGSWIARWSWIVTASAVVSALLSGTARAGILGAVGNESGVLMLTASLGLVAIGRETSDNGRRALLWSVVTGVSLSSIVGLLQIMVQAESGPFSVRDGRVTGLTPSAVYFGACAAAAGAVLLGRSVSGRRGLAISTALIGWFAFATSMSGTRVALGAIIALAVVAVVQRRDLSSLLGAAGVAVGLVVGRLAVAVFTPGVGEQDRLQQLNGSGRSTVWRYALDSLRDRPFFGFGPLQFRQAIQDDESVALSAHYKDGIEGVWFDAHNIVIQSLVTLGIVGVLCMTMLTILLLRRARGPLLFGAIALAMSWMLQPASLTTFPLALLLVGAACAAGSRSPASPNVAESSETPDELAETLLLDADVDIEAGSPVVAPESNRRMWLLVPGLFAAALLLVGDLAIQRAVDANDPERAAALVDLVPNDALLADVVAQLWVEESETRPDAAANAVAWGQRAVDAQPDRSFWRIRLAQRQSQLELFEDALVSLEGARELEPNSWAAVQGQYFLLTRLGRTDEVAELTPLACDLLLVEESACE